MDNLLKKAGAMLPHLDLFTHMAALRGLLHLAAHMEERGDRATLISQSSITLVGQDIVAEPNVAAGKGTIIHAAEAYALVRQLKGHEAAEYAVTHDELKALNNRAVQELENSPALAAFGETLARIMAAPAKAKAAASNAPAPRQSDAATPAATSQNTEGSDTTKQPSTKPEATTQTEPNKVEEAAEAAEKPAKAEKGKGGKKKAEAEATVPMLAGTVAG